MPNGVQSYAEWSQALNKEQRDYEIYRLLHSLDERLCRLERRPIWDKAVAFAGGIIGGFAAVIAYLKAFSGVT